MTHSRTDTDTTPEQFARAARTETELISPSRTPAEQGAGSREQENYLSDSTIHPTTSTSTPAHQTMDGTTLLRDTTAPVAGEPPERWIDGQLWLDGVPIHSTPRWIRRDISNPEPPTDQRPVGSVVARDLARCGSCSQHETVGLLRSERDAARATAADLSVELERTEGDLVVAIREATDARDQAARLTSALDASQAAHTAAVNRLAAVGRLHRESLTEPGWCLECRTAAFPCPTAQVLA